MKVGILTVSDRASAGIYEDKSGKEVEKFVRENFDVSEVRYRLVPDERELVAQALRELGDVCDLVLTTGGTGPAKRDVTPEATSDVCEKMLPGFGEAMRLESLKFVKTAVLSRQTAGIYKECVVINLPGNPRAIYQCLTPIKEAVVACVKLVK